MLARTALRLTTVAALEGATLAADRVYDSRLADLNPENVPDDGLPVIIVIADDDDGEAWSEQNGGPPFDRMVDLNIELSIAARVQYVDPANEAQSIYVIEAPDTDARLEASLDMMEFHAIRALAFGQTPYAVMFRKLARIAHRLCHRAGADDGVKIASRLLTLRCRINDDDIQSLDVSAPEPKGLDVLPEPLRSVAKILPAHSSGGLTCAAIAAGLSPLRDAVPLRGFDFRADAGEGDQPDDEVIVNVDLQGS